jgi:hypothetical protein
MRRIGPAKRQPQTWRHPTPARRLRLETGRPGSVRRSLGIRRSPVAISSSGL